MQQRTYDETLNDWVGRTGRKYILVSVRRYKPDYIALHWRSVNTNLIFMNLVN